VPEQLAFKESFDNRGGVADGERGGSGGTQPCEAPWPTSSLPVPVAPVTNAVLKWGAARRIRAKTSSSSGLRPTMPSNRQVFNNSPSQLQARAGAGDVSPIRAPTPFAQAGDGKRLGQIIAGSFANGFHGGFGGIVPGDEDHFRGGRGGENPLQHGDAVNARHHQVEKHDFGAVFERQLPTRRPGRWEVRMVRSSRERASRINSRPLGVVVNRQPALRLVYRRRIGHSSFSG